MIRAPQARNAEGVLSAYRNSAAVIVGANTTRFYADRLTQRYPGTLEPIDILMKVETHNHPTAISPFPGAATGAGGEIRDEGATGRGAKPKAGLTGFTVSNLNIPGFIQPWESYQDGSGSTPLHASRLTPQRTYGRPGRIASALQIMLEGP